ncbi:hypothetical protein ETB97_001431 [Aspergillus alliaceus]|uniref:Major facilitator superfamily (MFS) profile domain-containing protein n=1 Tax=Petromyces alliaceus TaxID=209559 RepID=A0A8H6A295_PETAA|nr:hypothetical protein ETB97_001431 [Aspergillus burnettii]
MAQIPVVLARNLETVLVGRFFVGSFGCAALSIIDGAMADIWGPIDSGEMIALFSEVSFAGPTFGPILAGFIVDSSLGRRKETNLMHQTTLQGLCM